MDNSYFTPTVEDLPGINARAIFVPDTTTLFKESIDTLPRFYREHTVERFDFSGGQIQNISRKQIIQQVFSGTDELNYEQLLLDCNAECLSRTNGRKIGF